MGFLKNLKGQSSYVDRSEVPVPDVEPAPPLLSIGWHLVPVAYFFVVATTVITTLVMYGERNRVDEWPQLCTEIQAAEASDCDPSKSLIFPTISRTAAFYPEYYIFAVGLTIASILNCITNYHVHRSAWGRAQYLNSIELIKPRIYCMPLFMHRLMRPRLEVMLHLSEIVSYGSSFCLAATAIISIRMNNTIHTYTALGFFGLYIAYLFIFTLNQHNIKNKCLANFPSPWRYICKVILLGCGMMVFIVVVGTFAGLSSNPCWNYGTSDFRRRGFGMLQYIACLLAGLFTLTHVEDIRQENTSRVFRELPKLASTIENPAIENSTTSETTFTGSSETDAEAGKAGRSGPGFKTVSIVIAHTVRPNAVGAKDEKKKQKRIHGKRIVENKPSHFRGLASDGISGVPEFQLADGIDSVKVYSKAFAKPQFEIGEVSIKNGKKIQCLSGNSDFIRIVWAESKKGYAWVERTQNGRDLVIRAPHKLDGAQVY